MCQVLNMSEFWIFADFRKYDRVLNMCQNAIMEGYWILQDSKYARFAQDSEYAWSMFHRDSKMLPVLNMPGLRTCDKVVNMRGLRRVLNMPE